MSAVSTVVTGDRCQHKPGDRAMDRPEVPFPKHWLYYIVIKFVVLAGAVALALRLYEVW
jgi:hypothetical protein